jgi:uncharacterized membrane protein YkoI
MKRTTLTMALCSVAALSAASVTYAAKEKAADNDAVALSSAKISLVDAIKAAEQHVGGKAAKAEYEKHKGQWVFDVEVVSGKKVMDVAVDAGSGKVLSAVEDKDDEDDAHDKAD